MFEVTESLEEAAREDRTETSEFFANAQAPRPVGKAGARKCLRAQKLMEGRVVEGAMRRQLEEAEVARDETMTRAVTSPKGEAQ